ncbi:uncharacterized protein [Castor canadensis]|uniref:Uncharacterized protein n=1 Tax=Castor canadensis TaxID=51338 RepID=A0AC58N232_CASCN
MRDALICACAAGSQRERLPLCPVIDARSLASLGPRGHSVSGAPGPGSAKRRGESAGLACAPGLARVRVLRGSWGGVAAGKREAPARREERSGAQGAGRRCSQAGLSPGSGGRKGSHPSSRRLPSPSLRLLALRATGPGRGALAAELLEDSGRARAGRWGSEAGFCPLLLRFDFLLRPAPPRTFCGGRGRGAELRPRRGSGGGEGPRGRAAVAGLCRAPPWPSGRPSRRVGQSPASPASRSLPWAEPLVFPFASPTLHAYSAAAPSQGVVLPLPHVVVGPLAYFLLRGGNFLCSFLFFFFPSLLSPGEMQCGRLRHRNIRVLGIKPPGPCTFLGGTTELYP